MVRRDSVLKPIAPVAADAATAATAATAAAAAKGPSITGSTRAIQQITRPINQQI